MLAPMQGLTNRALRALFIDMVRPDVVFTEFMRVRHGGGKILSASDMAEIAADEAGVPLVVQLVGHGRDNLVAAALEAQRAGAVHINLNMGCPYGRMTAGLTGGGMLRRPEELEDLLPALRSAVDGTFSVKVRAGYEDPRQVLGLLPLFESAGVDFLVLHPRTVLQEYEGLADHSVTAEVVRSTRLPVVANGDVRRGDQGVRLLRETGAAGLMLGRGGIADPFLFSRVRTGDPEPAPAERVRMLGSYLRALLPRYGSLFCGDHQVLGKLKGVLSTLRDAELERVVRKLQRAKNLAAFRSVLEEVCREAQAVLP
ncbi:MAG TPA: tRNA-dihydrouridine synthase family protein [Verrucomicrobiae bacterium]|nr:tRNA-dihydrouridine synthase family protein [Verrucomicrobiae bacterium]